jgi:glycosyltransferase involved in cell wall biosynthesis
MQEQFEQGKVSVVIPVYNEERFLRQALESVVEQVDCVIIGDNASTDGTEAICREFAEKYPHVVYFRNEENLGSIENYWLCVSKVQTEFLFHLGGHDTIPSNYVLPLKKKLQETEDAIGVFCDRYEMDLEGTIDPRNPASILCKTIFDKEGRSMAEYFMLPSPMERVAHYFLYTHPDCMWQAMHRTEPFQSYWLKTTTETFASVRWQLLLKEKMVYCEDTVSYRRNVHTQDTTLEFQNRIFGTKYAYLARANSHEAIGYFAKDALNFFVNTVDSTLQDHEKLDIFRRIYWTLVERYCFKTFELKCNLEENLFLVEEFVRLGRLRKLWTIIAFIFRVVKMPERLFRKYIIKPIKKRLKAA